MIKARRESGKPFVGIFSKNPGTDTFPPVPAGPEARYLVSERKLGFFVKVKEDQNFNRRSILDISRIKILI
jgi:hypothetical protein